MEDHAKLAMTVAAGLRRLGIAVDLAFDGDDALQHIALTDYVVVVLDRDLPGTHGDDVCRRVVQDRRDCRVLMLTAAGEIEDRVNGLGIGADDYLPKPFDFAELVARIHALARRSHPRVGPTLNHGDIVLDRAQHVVSRRGRPLSLSPKEFAVLERLLAAQGTVVSAEELLEQVWDGDANPFSQAVKTTVSRLRTKLGEPPIIVTVAKSGYRI